MCFGAVILNDDGLRIFASAFPGQVSAAAPGFRRTHRLAQLPRNELHQLCSSWARFDWAGLAF